ncbi:hypothetical protein TSUD_04380 [Trifolium subterraneum]|nr:hypothetical protein TSUD_04380 [Trifolium subterraneum]
MEGVGGHNNGGCKSWQEDIYWTHFQFIHFTQFLKTDFQQHLALPKTFSDNVKKKLQENVTLKGPSGIVWDVGLTTRDDTLYFTNGWQQFVEDHSLKENDVLVFKYKGESHFEVLIFGGESLCEKAASYFVGKCSNVKAEHKAKDTNTATEEVINTASDGAVERGSPETTPLVVPSQTTGKRTKKPVNEVMPDQTKKRGTSPKAANSNERELEKEQSGLSNIGHGGAILGYDGATCWPSKRPISGKESQDSDIKLLIEPLYFASYSTKQQGFSLKQKSSVNQHRKTQ